MASRIRQRPQWGGLAAIVIGVFAALGAGGGEPEKPGSSSATGTTSTGGTTSGHEHHATPAPATPSAGTPAPAKGAKPARDGVYKTITGEVMDPACFLEAGPKSIGQGHYQCAIDCIRSGQTLAIYDREADRIYFIAGELPGKNPNEPLLPYLHKKVDVTGTVYNRSQAWGIVIVKVALHKGGGAAPKSASKDQTR